jgi:putative membrane protein
MMAPLSVLLPLGFLPIVLGFMGIAFWILLIALIVLLVRGTRPSAPEPRGPAVRLLDERYARGEISREDFLERRSVLGGLAPGASAENSG